MDSLINEKVGAWLLMSGNSRENLANEIGISRPTLASRLSGKSKWNWDEVVKLAKIVGCTLDEMAGMPAL